MEIKINERDYLHKVLLEADMRGVTCILVDAEGYILHTTSGDIEDYAQEIICKYESLGIQAEVIPFISRDNKLWAYSVRNELSKEHTTYIIDVTRNDVHKTMMEYIDADVVNGFIPFESE